MLPSRPAALAAQLGGKLLHAAQSVRLGGPMNRGAEQLVGECAQDRSTQVAGDQRELVDRRSGGLEIS